MSSLAAAFAIARTEFVASLRDRMTLVYTVLMPLAMYPVLFWIAIQGYLILDGKDKRTEVRVALVAVPLELNVDSLIAALEQVPVAVPNDGDATDDEDAETGPERAFGPIVVESLELLDVPLEDAVSGDGAWDVVLQFHADAPTELLYDASRSRSTLAKRRVEQRTAHLAEEMRIDALAARGTQLEHFDPFEFEVLDLADEKDIVGLLFSMILPMLFVVMTVLGGFYPAVDTTAGEKERKTAETTALLPVPSHTIVLGKIMAVALAALVATTLNISGMALAAGHLLASMGEGIGLSVEPPWPALARMIPFALVFVVFTSCVLVASASLTSTFKQGQSLLGMVQMVFMGPAVMGTLPLFDLSVTNAWVPILQVSLVFKALLQGESAPASASPAAFAIVLVSGIAYACLAVWFTVWLRRREELFSDGFDPKSLVPFLFKRAKPKQA